MVMNSKIHGTAEERGPERMASNGFRLTPQRRHVYQILLQRRDHPTANEVYFQAKQELPEISMATVYNCLDALVQCGMIRQVNLDRAATRYCANLEAHAHFCCDQCGGVFDVNYNAKTIQLEVPPGFETSHYDLSIRGFCASCNASRKESSASSGTTLKT